MMIYDGFWMEDMPHGKGTLYGFSELFKVNNTPPPPHSPIYKKLLYIYFKKILV